MSITCCADQSESLLDRETRLIGNTTVAATVVIILFLVSNSDRYVQKIEAVVTCICYCLNEVTSPCSTVLRNHAVQIEFCLRSEIPECFEYVPTVASRITHRRMDIVFAAINRERVCQLWSWLIKRIDYADSDELALIFRVAGVKCMKI